MSLQKILLLVLMTSAFIVGYTGFYGALASNSDYGMTNVTDFSSLNKIRTVTTKVNTIETTFRNSSASNPSNTGYVLFTAPYQYVVGAVQAGLLVFDVPDIMFSIVTDMSKMLGVPQWIVDVIYTSILIIVLFAAIYFVTGKE